MSTGMSRMGRPPRFETPEQMEVAFYEWQAEFEPGGSLVDEIPDVEGFCYYIGSYRELLMEYERKPEFSRTIKEIKNWMYYRKKQLAMQNKMNAAVFIFDAKNNFNYVDKTENDVTSGGNAIAPVLVKFMGDNGPSDSPSTS